MLNEAINIARSRRGPHRIKDIGELVAHIGLDKTAGGDGQCAEVALVLQCRRHVNLQEIGNNADIAEKFPEKGIMRCGECFHWRTVRAPTSTEYKRHLGRENYKINYRGTSHFTMKR